MIVRDILIEIILPIFVLIGVGSGLDRIFRLDLRTLSKVNYYALVPALVFVKIVEADFSRFSATNVLLFAVVHLLILFVLVWLLFSLPLFRRHRAGLVCASLFTNVGNYGLPLAIMAFSNALLGVHVLMLLLQNLAVATLGVWLLQPHGKSGLASVIDLFKVPLVHALLLGVVIQGFAIPLPQLVEVPIGYLSDALIPVALMTLGVQLTRSRLTRNVLPIAIVLLIRLAVSPLLAWGLALAMGLDRSVAAVLIVATALPTAVNVYILSAEFERDEELTSQAVFWTTLVSALSLSVVLALLQG